MIMSKWFKSSCLILLVFSIISFTCRVFSESSNGWVKIDFHYYYYDNSDFLTGTQAIDGKLYTFDENGVLLGNGKVQNIDNEFYYIDVEGLIVTGWQTVEGSRYYFRPETGCAVKDTISTIEGLRYIFDNSGQLLINNWYRKNRLYYYGDGDGHPLEGYHVIDGYSYYFHYDGYSMSGLFLVDDEYHYFDTSDNHRGAKGWRKIDGFWYFFNESTLTMQKTPMTINDQSYFFGKDGKLGIGNNMILYSSNQIIGVDTNGNELTGFFEINGYTYYHGFFYDRDFNMHYSATPNDFCDIPQNGRDYYYLFDELGRMQTGLIEQYGNLYYYAENGVRQSGWQTINGKTYCFGRYTTHSYDTCCAYAGGTYYIEKDGVYAYYEFATDGALIPNLEGKSRIELPEGILHIQESAFENTQCELIIIPDGCISIESRAFANCHNLIYVRIPPTIATIAIDAFDGSEQAIIDKR